MIHIAARATNGVKIPDRRQTRQAIIDTFKEQLTSLRDRLNVRECHIISTASPILIFPSE
jgi:hypothetical protein